MGEAAIGGASSGYPLIPLISKTIPPAETDSIVPRERIIGLLNQGRHRKITFVSAAEGYGKTTALANFFHQLQREQVPTTWFTADARDCDPERFWLNLHYALRATVGLEGIKPFDSYRSIPRLESIWKLANDMSVLAEEQGGIVVIVEEFDTLDGSQSMQDLFELVSALSTNVHLFLSSRTTFTKHSFPAIRIDTTPLSITARDLAFTCEESACEIARLSGRSLSRRDSDALFDKTQGWPFGTREAALLVAAADEPEEAIRDFSGTNKQLNEFFENEVFRELNDEEQDFLTRTALAGLLSPHFCSYVLDMDNAKEVLDGLCRRNVFVEPVDARRDYYALHPLFFDWLEQKATSLSPAELRRLNSRASRWCLQHHRIVTAAKHRILASERGGVFNLVRAAFPETSTEDLLDLLQFRAVPDLSDLDSRFCLLSAWAYIFSVDFENALFWIDRIRQDAATASNKRLQLSLAVLEAKMAYLDGCFEEGHLIAVDIEPQLNDAASLPLRIVLINCYAEACDQQGEPAQGMEWHRNMAAQTNEYRFEFMSAINDYEIAYSLMEQGCLDRALQLCRKLARTLPDDYPIRGAVLALNAFIEVMHGNADVAEDKLVDARSLVSKHQNPDMYFDWCVARAWVFVAQGHLDDAEDSLLEAMEFVKYRQQVIPRGAAILPFQCRAVIKMLSGDFVTALTIYEDFDTLGLSDTVYARLTRRLIEALSLEEKDTVCEAVEQLRVQALGYGYRVLVLDMGLQIAILEYAKGCQARTLRVLHDLLSFAAEQNVMSSFLQLGDAIRPILALYLIKAKPDYRRRAFVRRLLSRPEMHPVEDDECLLMQAAHITKREREILHLAASGLSRQEIASELCISDGTVKSHLSHLYEKFGVRRYRDLLSRLLELGIA